MYATTSLNLLILYIWIQPKIDNVNIFFRNDLTTYNYFFKNYKLAFLLLKLSITFLYGFRGNPKQGKLLK